MPRLKLTRQLLDAIEVDRRTEFYDTLVRDLELRAEALPSTVRTWFVRYGDGEGGKRARFKIGRYPDIPITIARERAQKIIADTLNGKDPSGQRKEDRASPTVRQLGDLYIEKYARRYQRSWRQGELMLVADIYPAIGTEKASKVTRRDLLDIIDRKLDAGKVPAARNVKALLGKMFGWAFEHEYIPASPAMGLKAPGEPPQRDRVLSGAELHAIWNALPAAAVSPAMKDVFRLLVLLGQRSGEVAGMRRSEIDLEYSTWSIPGNRTKNGAAHTVPLAAPALAIVTAAMQRTNGEALFTRIGTPFTSSAVSAAARNNLQVLKTAWKPHDLRRSAATMMGDLKIAPHLIEVVLNHRSGFRAGVAGNYNKSLYAEEVREALDRWAAHVMALVR